MNTHSLKPVSFLAKILFVMLLFALTLASKVAAQPVFTNMPLPVWRV